MRNFYWKKFGKRIFLTAPSNTTPDEFYSSLTCTLIICRAPETGIILSVLPVWWNYDIALIDGEQQSDFSWNTLNRFLESRF